VVVSFASYLVWFWLMRHYPATRVSAFTLLTPLFGLLAWRGAAG
jgi:drug/metabolite transporter (DMT)-like permease